MQSAADDSIRNIPRHRFGDAFKGGLGLTEPGRAFLAGKLGNDGGLGRADDPLSLVELGDVCDPKRRQELRAWFESAFALGWDRAMFRSRELGDLAPAARLVPDGRFSPRSLDQRVRAALERAGYSRWSALLDLTVGGLLAMPGLGPTTVVVALAACFERSLIGLSTGVESYDGSDLAVLLTEERRGPKQPVLESLLDAVATHVESPSANSRTVDAARRLLVSSAPWSLEHASALSGLLSGITDDQDRSIFIRTELHPERRSLAELAEELGISSSRVAQRRDRAGLQVREELAAAPAPLGWLVDRVSRSLGRASTAATIQAVLRRFGFDPSTGQEARRAQELLLWLAGPFDPVSRCPGWRCVQPDDLLSRTRKMLIQDGGLQPFAATAASLEALGVTTSLVRSWLGACGAAVVDDDLVVSLSGSLIDVLERLMDAAGHGLTASECLRLFLSGGRSVEESKLQRALRGRRFRRLTDDVYELASWLQPSASVRASEASALKQPTPESGDTDPRGVVGRDAHSDDEFAQIWESPPASTVLKPDTDDSAFRRAWLSAIVDDDLMRGGECSVPESIVRCLGIGWRQRRTFSSRYGPVTLTNDGAEPSRGPLRPIAMAVGAGPGDVLVLGFAAGGDVVVEVRAASDERIAAVGADSPPTGRSRAGVRTDEATDETGEAT